MTHLALHLISSYLLSKQKQRRSARPVLKKTGFPAAEEQCSTAYCVSCSSACSHTRESRTFSDRRWKARNGKGISMCLGRELQTQKVFPCAFLLLDHPICLQFTHECTLLMLSVPTARYLHLCCGIFQAQELENYAE